MALVSGNCMFLCSHVANMNIRTLYACPHVSLCICIHTYVHRYVCVHTYVYIQYTRMCNFRLQLLIVLHVCVCVVYARGVVSRVVFGVSRVTCACRASRVVSLRVV